MVYHVNHSKMCRLTETEIIDIFGLITISGHFHLREERKTTLIADGVEKGNVFVEIGIVFGQLHLGVLRQTSAKSNILKRFQVQ